MEDSFFKVLLTHKARYPQMQPQDNGKLAYQRTFGPAHLSADPDQLLQRLLVEWQSLPSDLPPQSPESIGGGLCRFPLTGEHLPSEAAPLLADLTARTGLAHTGSLGELEQRLALLHRLHIPGLAAWVQTYQAQGCPALSHSAAFRTAYRPHYRLLQWDYACYFSVLLAIRRLMQERGRGVIAIDGRCGSGKTHLAQLIAQLFPCNLFHMDDFYLSPAQRPPNWTEIPGGNMDFSRFRTQVLLPVRAGTGITFRPFVCGTGQLGAPVTASPRPLTVVEGSYALHPALEADYDLTIFLTCDPGEQRRRLQAREGAQFAAFETRWIPMEERYFSHWKVERASHLVVDTTDFLRLGEKQS